MSTQLVPIQVQQFTPEQMQLITSTIAKGATKDELQLFLYRCQNMGLDPLKPGQIHFVKYSNGPGTIVVGIEGFRSIAHRSGKLSGIKRGVIKDEKGALTGAWAEVYRSDWQQPAREEVPLAEYDTRRGPWQKMPETMLKKVAEAAALRMAFPNELGGVYTNEEMDQAESGKFAMSNMQPEPEDGVQVAEYCVPYGPLAKKPISQCDPVKLREFIEERESAYKKSGKPHGEWFKELLRHAEPIIAAFENQIPDEG